MAPSDGLEPPTYCSASKRSNPLSYEGINFACGILLYGFTIGKVINYVVKFSPFVLRESPSGKASAFQADIRGFESHLPLLFSVKCLGVRWHWNT